MSEPTTTENRPTPVLDLGESAGLASGLVVAFGGALVVLGYATAEQVQTWAVVVSGIVTAIIAVIAYLLPLRAARKATALVTPVADPRDDAGRPLVPVTDSTTPADGYPGL